MTRITDFMSGLSPDHKGRYISDIWKFNQFWLEHTHDYIQWLFPIEVAHARNSFAPCLTVEDRLVFDDAPYLRQQQATSFLLMLDFFGLMQESGRITAKPDLNIRKHIWLKRGGHNHLRISRIIRSLALCGNLAQAEKFQRAVIKIGLEHGQITDKTIHHWLSATQNIPPSNNHVNDD